jgi:hypothetical protein
MKKLLLFGFSVAFAGIVNAQDCTALIDNSADSIGLNPNPIAGSVAGIPYDEVNTLVLPGRVDNILTPTPGDTISLCAIEILNVIGMPAGYTYDVWAFHTASPTSNYDVLAQTIDTIHLFPTPVTRVCIRLKHPNPPASTDMTDGMMDRDSVKIKVAVGGYIEIFGCQSAGATATDTFDINLPIKDAIYAGIGDEENNSFTVGANHPNPANEVTYLNFTTPNAGEVTITLFDAVGRNIRNIQMGSNPGANNYALNTSDLRSGVYMYNITFNGKTISKKLIVNR